MTLVRNTVLSAALLAAAASAQSPGTPLWVPPGLSGNASSSVLDFTTNPVLTPLTTNSRPIYACSMHKMPSDPPGQVTLSFTIRALQGYGNPGFSGFVIAEWNPSSATPLRLTHYADAVNDSYVDYNLQLEPIAPGGGGGRYAVFDRFAPPAQGLAYIGVYLSARPDDRSAFGAPVPVSNIQGAILFGDPTLGYVGGRLMLFYAGEAMNSSSTLVQGILMDELLGADTASPHVAGHPVLVAQPLDRSPAQPLVLHSPSPVNGADGNVQGLFLAEGDDPAGRSDIYFAADLDPDTPHVLAVESDNWLDSGGTAGGMAMFAERMPPEAPRVIEGAWLVGDDAGIGETADVAMYAFSAPCRPPALTVVYTGLGWLNAPATLPNTLGELGILPAFWSGSVRFTDGDQRAIHQIRVPRLRALRGLDIPIQGLSLHIAADGGAVRTLTNTATIRVR